MPSAAHQATGRQRRDSRRPSGKSSSRKVVGTRIQGIHERSAYQAAVLPSSSGPAPLLIQYSAYEPAKDPRPAATAAPRKSQPIALSGWREAIRPPTAAN